MSETKNIVRLSKAAREFNVGISTIVDFLAKKGHEIESNPNTKLPPEIYKILIQEYQKQKTDKEESRKMGLEHTKHETISITQTPSDDDDSDVDISEQTQKDIIITDPNDLSGQQEHIDQIVAEDTAEKKKKEVAETSADKKVDSDIHSPADKKLAEEETEIEDIEVTSSSDIPSDSEEEKDKDKSKKEPKVLGTLDLSTINEKTKPDKKSKEERDTERKEKEEKRQNEITERKKAAAKKEKDAIPEEEESDKAPPEEKEKTTPQPETPIKKAPLQKPIDFLKTEFEQLSGPTILGKMSLPEPQKKDKGKRDKKTAADDSAHRGKRKRIKKPQPQSVKETKSDPRSVKKKTKSKRFEKKPAIDEEVIQKQIKETLARLSAPTGKSKSSKLRRQKRDLVHQNIEKQRQEQESEVQKIKVTEFVTVNELANLMDVNVNEIIATCMQLGLFVSINQRLDAETLTIVAEEFGFEVEFVSIEVQESLHLQVDEKEDEEKDLLPRHPIVTVMGHVDHGKTSLLDYIRKTNVIAGESGGITQHIGAYEVTLEKDQKITFLDTPGHEAFTAMRARGAKVTDLAIIVIAADDQIMPQTKEAINHATAAGVPLIFAINKIDKPGANPEKVKERLAAMNFLVEEWGGKYQSQDISAKNGTNVELLLEKVLLEAELLDLKANPNRAATGTVLESSLDKGRGYIAKILVQNGTLKIGDILLAGCHSGRVKAMYNERNQKIEEAGPGTPLLLLGLHGAPQAGDLFNVMADEKEAKNLASKRLQLQREQGIRTQKHITLDEIGRRIAIGDFKELNIIVKGDVDGSVEALSDSLLKLSSEKIQVNVIHKSVGQVSESDVLLASASDAIIIGFQVRPSVGARKLAEQEEIDIRLYSIIYNAIEEIKSAIEGMLEPVMEEKITCNIEIREIFKITKVGTIAGCMVLDGKINKNSDVRIIRDGIVIYTGKLGSLKRFKDDVKEVSAGYECGLNIENFNDIKVGDIVEGFEQVEVKPKI